jgi:cytidylate kinase
MSREKRTRKKAKGTVICICGMAGSGKSTVAKRLARKYGLAYYSGGQALKAMALGEGGESSRCGWWESQEGMQFLEKRHDDPKFDEAVDKKLLEVARQGNVVLDSWTMPWLLKEGFKTWLEGSREKRAERVARRDRISVRKALEALRKKEERTKAIYERLYGFSIGEDFKPFHLVLDTNDLSSDEVFHVLCAVIDNVGLHLREC